MSPSNLTGRLIVNDPIYGFVNIPHGLLTTIIKDPSFQRLRRISQLGLTSLVYPGAHHTRFQHVIGAMHLTEQAIAELRAKGNEISNEEAEAVKAAILLHDIGHGPFSHALENSLVTNIDHEYLSRLFMERMNRKMDGKLDLAIQIFRNNYEKKFLCQLVSGQLDMDRLDYLKRDSFFTGVYEGVVGSERIIQMLHVKDDKLVVEQKGIYSIEKFLIARRLMYWQVYFHKTVVAAEFLLVRILKRAKELASAKIDLFGPRALKKFLENNFDKESFARNKNLLDAFSELDDFDVFSSIKQWRFQIEDPILAMLCHNLVERNLYRIELSEKPFAESVVGKIKDQMKKKYRITDDEAAYFVFTGSVKNNAYDYQQDTILIWYKDGSLKDIAEASDQFNISALSNTVTKHFLCYPKDLAFN